MHKAELRPSKHKLRHQAQAPLAERKQCFLQEEYLKQYMAQVALIQQHKALARAGALDAQGHQDLTDLKTDLAIAKGLLFAVACAPARAGLEG